MLVGCDCHHCFLRRHPPAIRLPIHFLDLPLADGSVPMVPGSTKGSRRTASHTTVPNWRYRDLQQDLLQGSPSGFVRCVRFPWAGGRGGRLRHHRLLPGCPRCGVPWSTGRNCRQEIGMRSNHRWRAVLVLSQANCDSLGAPRQTTPTLFNSIAEPSVVRPTMMPASPASSLARRAYLFLASLRCLFAVLQPAGFSLLGLSESMRAL